jgi:hypothetical protein
LASQDLSVPRSFTDTFRGHHLLDFKSLLDNAGCQCLPRLLLCGYKLSKSDKHGNGTMIEPGHSIDKGESSFRDLRQTIRGVIVENPLVQDDIKAYLEKVLRDKGVKAEASTVALYQA